MGGELRQAPGAPQLRGAAFFAAVPAADARSAPPAPRAQVASAFSHMLNLHNLTEDVANTQTERAARMFAL